ncbi:PilW family protein [Pseudoalteromonas ruthenica]|uniref:Pilus assembly protein PilW n=1 Tax=Pseudoalteromonas ruthenica TaxID=151081 RepID=A0A0F4PZM3_9GAMM|nr:PilW family protein [Pseudoalteromonas ruthenica]KJZ00873.1 pilus assembly protein PilW [Pseudoalteromonas ruthenica]KJZ01074.1 pilus assembly protein PilW [Pseudoalteromonas ruthenica]TMO85770.1 pilus assembly protein PilW [Pseudoalteromonas ruthenica]TMO92540.1 pilus assembly protein PilW [Pseudoalteromonas ruthenica]TMO99009.1 pilus assembly protein PilW [Pseudoalteromonas ruthenica]|tara:strand:- start:5807 stop:6796 length:990 start_codon:yes stop_codon:yes gene_type:complete
MESRTKQLGLTLVEMMVSLLVGAVILAGVMFTYVGMKATTNDTMSIGELQETGRLALEIISSDIQQAGFWGTFYEKGLTPSNTQTLPPPAAECASGPNNGSFPDGSNVPFLFVFALTSTGADHFGCLTSPNDNSDIIQVKRLEGNNTLPGGMQGNRYYFVAAHNEAQFTTSALGALPKPNATIWPYTHNVYYVDEQTFVVNGENLTIPVLMRRRLTTAGMRAETVMEGVENIYLNFGLDTNGDNRVDSYRSANQMQLADWAQQGVQVLTIQLNVLVRALQPDPSANIVNQTYQLGGVNGRTLNFNDNFRRAVFTSTIQLRNVGANLWSI